jgi:hypothetical protein
LHFGLRYIPMQSGCHVRRQFGGKARLRHHERKKLISL